MEPVDMIATLLIVACTTLVILGHDGTMKIVIISIGSFYFGRKSK